MVMFLGGDGGVSWRGDVCWRRKHAGYVYPFFPRLKKGWLGTVMRGVVGQGFRAWGFKPCSATLATSGPHHKLHPWQG